MTAARYTDAIIGCCEALSTFPNHGAPRDDVRPGLRITNYRKRAVIAYEVDMAASRVCILGVYYGGRDFEDSIGGLDDEAF